MAHQVCKTVFCLTAIACNCCYSQPGFDNVVSVARGFAGVKRLADDPSWQMAVEVSPNQVRQLADLRQQIWDIPRNNTFVPPSPQELEKPIVSDLEKRREEQEVQARIGLAKILTQAQLDRYSHLVCQQNN